MAKIPVEKESGGGGWWKWLLALLLLGGLIWLIATVLDTDDPELAGELMTPDTTAEQAAEPEGSIIGDILDNPDRYYGATFPGAEVTVASDREMTDRGFWIQDDGRHLFSIIIDQPREVAMDINPGATLRIDGGTLRQPDDLANIQGEPLEQNTANIARQQEIFLVVDESNIQVLEEGNPQEGTDPARDVQ